MCENAKKCEHCSGRKRVLRLTYIGQGQERCGKWLCEKCIERHEAELEKEKKEHIEKYGEN